MVQSEAMNGKRYDVGTASSPRISPRASASKGTSRKVLFYPSMAAADLPPGWAAATSIDETVGAIVLASPTEPDELKLLLDRPGRDVLPLVTAGESECSFADTHVETPASPWIAEALQRVAPITDRVAALPRSAAFSIEPETILLARLYTRAGELTPVRDPRAKNYVSYPLAGRLTAVAEIANALVEKACLTRRFFDRFHVCPECRSARLNVREECHKCRSANLSEKSIVHHFSCAHEAPEGDFLRGRDLICPKCSKTLRHIGIDYDRPGSAQVCRDCGHTDDTVAVGFICIDCGRHHTTEAVAVQDWYSYALTPLGIQVLLDAANGETESRVKWGAGSPSAFRVLLGQAIREAEHLDSPFTVLQMEFRAADRIRREDRRLWTETLKLAGDVVANAMRPVDVMLSTENSILVLMPHLSPAETAPFGAQIAQEMRRVLRADPGTEIELLDLEAVHRLMSEVR